MSHGYRWRMVPIRSVLAQKTKDRIKIFVSSCQQVEARDWQTNTQGRDTVENPGGVVMVNKQAFGSTDCMQQASDAS